MQPQLALEEFLKALAIECYSRRNFIFVMFLSISLSFLIVGSIWPKKYTAFSIIHIDETNILQSLMRGAAETTQAIDHASNAREIIQGEIIMNKLLEDAGWLDDEPSEVKQERIKQELKKKIKLNMVGDGLLKISYRDSIASRAYLTTRKLAELFIDEGEKSKSKESKAAFDFIEKQVNTYLTKLTKIESDLREFRSENLDSRPGLESEVLERISNFQRKIEQSRLDLSEEMIRSQSLDDQLSGEAAMSISQSKEGQYRTKINDLQEKRENLRLDFTDTYPDIVKLTYQISDLKHSMTEEIKRRDQAKKTARLSGDRFVDESILLNPIYQELRSKAAATETKMMTLRARISEMTKMLKSEYIRAKDIHGGAAILSSLTRNYNVNQGIYQDLLKRLENARVSKNLDEQRSGLKFEIQEPAKLPLIPTGLRFLHFAVVGLVLGFFIPIAVIFMFFKFDPRIRFSQVISSELDIPILGEFRIISSYSELYSEKVNLIYICTGIFFVLFVYGLISWLKFTGKL